MMVDTCALSRGSIAEAGWLPLVGQQFFDAIRRVRWQPLENVFEVRVRLMSVDSGGMKQAHDVGGALFGPKAAGEQPVRSAKRNRADQIFDPVIVCWQVSGIDVARERRPAR